MPQVITIEEMLANFEEYESELVKINGVTFSDAGEEFANGVVYPISDNSKATANFRTTFYDVDYIGTTIPSGVEMLLAYLTRETKVILLPVVRYPIWNGILASLLIIRQCLKRHHPGYQLL